MDIFQPALEWRKNVLCFTQRKRRLKIWWQRSGVLYCHHDILAPYKSNWFFSLLDRLKSCVLKWDDRSRYKNSLICPKKERHFSDGGNLRLRVRERWQICKNDFSRFQHIPRSSPFSGFLHKTTGSLHRVLRLDFPVLFRRAMNQSARHGRQWKCSKKENFSLPMSIKIDDRFKARSQKGKSVFMETHILLLLWAETKNGSGSKKIKEWTTRKKGVGFSRSFSSRQNWNGKKEKNFDLPPPPPVVAVLYEAKSCCWKTTHPKVVNLWRERNIGGCPVVVPEIHVRSKPLK